MERVVAHGRCDVIADVLREPRVDFVENILAVKKRPHLTDGLVADPGHHASCFSHHEVGRSSLVQPVLLRVGKLVGDAVALARLLVDVAHGILGRLLVGHVVDARTHVHYGLEHRVRRDILDTFAIDPHLPTISDGLSVLFASADHSAFSLRR